MIEAGGLVQQRQSRRQFSAETPFVSATVGSFEGRAPAVPPRRRAAGDGLDDQNRGAPDVRGEQRAKQRIAGLRVELVHAERGQDAGTPPWKARRADLTSSHLP